MSSYQLLFFVILIIICVTGIYYALRNIDAANWPVAQGKIISSKSMLRSDSDEDTFYEIVATYNYRVEDRVYQGERIRFGGKRASSYWGANDIVQNQYFPGASVEVYVNPLDPTDAVLEISDSCLSVLSIIFVLGFFVVMVAQIIRY